MGEAQDRICYKYVEVECSEQVISRRVLGIRGLQLNQQLCKIVP